MSLHVSEPVGRQLPQRMFRTWTCDVIETATGAVVETTREQKEPEQAQAHAARIIARLEAAYPTRLPTPDA